METESILNTNILHHLLIRCSHTCTGCNPDFVSSNCSTTQTAGFFPLVLCVHRFHLIQLNWLHFLKLIQWFFCTEHCNQCMLWVETYALYLFWEIIRLCNIFPVIIFKMYTAAKMPCYRLIFHEHSLCWCVVEWWQYPRPGGINTGSSVLHLLHRLQSSTLLTPSQFSLPPLPSPTLCSAALD